MKKIRIGNDIKIEWSIFKKSGGVFLLEGLDLIVSLKDKFGRKKIDDFVISGNVIKWTFPGKDQRRTGIYSLELVINNGAEGMITTDACQFVHLVPCSCEVSGSDDNGVYTETIELRSSLTIGGGGEGGGEGYDDTAIWEALNDKVDKEKGKGLSSNDFTDAYVEQLASLDDTYQPKGDYVETKNLATINGKPLNEGGNIEIEGGSGGGASIEVDNKLSTTSENPVQNKVITAELNKKAETGAIPTKLSQLTDNVGFAKQADVEAGYQPKGDYVTDDKLSSKGYATEKYVDDALEGKQDTIEDLDSIRSGAGKGATAVQPSALEDYATTQQLTELSAQVGKVSERVDDLEQGGQGGDSSVFEAIPEITPYEDILAAYEANKHVICRRFNYVYSLVRAHNDKIYFSCVSEDYANTMICNSVNRWTYYSNPIEVTKNKVTSITDKSTDTQYPSAKAVYDFVNNALGIIINGDY